jgi:hypothetical protein
MGFILRGSYFTLSRSHFRNVKIIKYQSLITPSELNMNRKTSKKTL